MRPTIDLVLESVQAQQLVREAIAECRPDVRVEAFCDAAQALPGRDGRRCDLLLLDWIIGGAITLPVVDRLRAHPRVPLVVLTHAARDRDIDACNDRDCLLVEYPDNFDGLVERLRLLLEVYAPLRGEAGVEVL
jgi:DNA-binding response OmpR family regulator